MIDPFELAGLFLVTSFGHPKKVTKDKMHEIGNFDYRKHLPATFPKEYPHSHNFILTVRMFIKFEK
jgi:hypothetical protein